MDVMRYVSYGLLVGVPLAVVFSEKIGCPAKVSGPSMRPALNPTSSAQQSSKEDVVWVSRLHWNKHGARIGAVVAFKCPTNPSDRLVKRIIGVEQDIIISRSYMRREIYIPQGHVWVEGDNSARSKDCNSFGPISKGLIIGTVTHVIWPPHRIHRVEHILTPEQHSRRQCLQ